MGPIAGSLDPLDPFASSADPNVPSTACEIALAAGRLVPGVALQSVNAVAVAAIGAAFVPVLRPLHRLLAYGHLAVRLLEGLVIVGIGVFMLIARDLVNYEPVIYMFTGTAGLMLSAGLLRAGLVAAWLARLGVIGYLAILAALPIELLTAASLDSLPGMLLYVPGGLFELLLPIVLIARLPTHRRASRAHRRWPRVRARRGLTTDEHLRDRS